MWEEVGGSIGHLAANVANMSATCRNDTRFCSNFGQMGGCRQHKIEDVGTFCVGLSQCPYFPPKNQTSPSAYVEIYYGMGVTYAQIRTLMLSTHCSGHQLSDCLKKATSWWQKGRELAVKRGYGMTVLVALEEERGEVDTYMVLSSYYYDMSAINDTTRHTIQEKKSDTAWCRRRVSCVGPLCRKTRRQVFKTNFWRHQKCWNLQLRLVNSLPKVHSKVR